MENVRWLDFGWLKKKSIVSAAVRGRRMDLFYLIYLAFAFEIFDFVDKAKLPQFFYGTLRTAIHPSLLARERNGFFFWSLNII